MYGVISDISGVYDSVGQPKAGKPEVPGSTPGSSCFSLMFIKNLINNKSKHKKQMLLFVLYYQGPLTFIYNMYYDFCRCPFVSDICILFIIYICDSNK